MEIERKFLITNIPFALDSYSHKELEQGYLSTEPVVRVRKEDDEYYLTYKSSGLLAREEYNLLLTEKSFHQLIKKADGIIITKTRYYLPIEHHLTIELDIFHEKLAPLIIAEVEFPTKEDALSFSPLPWFQKEVTYDGCYHNNFLCMNGLPLDFQKNELP